MDQQPQFPASSWRKKRFNHTFTATNVPETTQRTDWFLHCYCMFGQDQRYLRHLNFSKISKYWRYYFQVCDFCLGCIWLTVKLWFFFCLKHLKALIKNWTINRRRRASIGRTGKQIYGNKGWLEKARRAAGTRHSTIQQATEREERYAEIEKDKKPEAKDSQDNLSWGKLARNKPRPGI